MRATRHGWTGVALAVLWMTAVSAQGPQISSDKAATPVTVDGCVVDRPVTGAPPPAGSQIMNADRYVLAKAAVAPPPAADATASKTPATQVKTPASGEFRLNGADSMLAPYVNHRVQVSGTVSAASPAGAQAARGRANETVLKVDAVMKLADSCS